jgi:hypothetical protein
VSVTGYQVTWDQPQKVLRTRSATRLYNRSVDQSVYVSDERLGGASGFLLGPGMSLTWEAQKEVYLWRAAPGAVPVPVTSVDDGGEFTDPSTIATAILQQGLAQQIADAISFTGVPPSNLPVLLGSFLWGAGNPNDAFTLPAAVSRYQSCMLEFVTSPAISFPGDYVSGYRLSNGPYYKQFELCFSGPDSAARGTVYTMPVLAPAITVQRIGLINPFSDRVNVYGSYATFGWRWQGAGTSTAPLGSISGSSGDTSTWDWTVGAKGAGAALAFCGGRSGFARLVVRSSATVAGLLSLSDSLTGAILTRITITATAGSSFESDFIMPSNVVRVDLSSALVTSSLTISITYATE